MNTVINATMREDQGKGASRRLRHNEQIPAIIYGAGKEPNTITLHLHEITHLLENEESYTSMGCLAIKHSVNRYRHYFCRLFGH
jgi:large subunit ribosomal protein L25